ncbi:hypothetical protein GZ212_06375 [Mangrovimonas sp. CR14]|uniref:enhanced serine sensitivity protein SseB C-terminal domain-containing protein n=1 Tax=Mangrovimonas sp. CR14 TaxID=2706120 RepID=UPI0014234A8F|nr:enhanced serine sensitivity protein SseB C-terminal domain-containing protein [Mangrovimonas sp. CR14]NIK91770.1 hypothetical protein [Mangrovimonas sp. CR14]
MGLFDIFKKKKTGSSFPDNELENTLMEAATKASARPQFYQKLLWNDLIVLTNGNYGISEGMQTLEKDSTVALVTFENGQIPVFTSTNRIFDKDIIKEEVPYLAIRGQDLFGMTKGATLILNPYSDYGKELIPQEIEKLMDGSIFEESNDKVIEEDTQIQIGQPAAYPTELVNAMSDLFRRQGLVKAAFLAAIRMGQSETRPHLMIALDMEGTMKAVTNEAGPLAERIFKEGIIDFIQLDTNNDLSQYFLTETQPFYKR